jgi:L-alanine-DL-glutamate epimerase-like enolase superfamily enzyme
MSTEARSATDVSTITDVTVDSYRQPIEPPIRNGRYTYASHDLCLVRISTDCGNVGLGVGDGGVGLVGAPAMIRGTVESLRPALVGRNPLWTERIWADLWNPKLLGRRGFTTRVVSTIDLALWDLKGKLLRTSVADLLGRCHETVAAYIAAGYYRDDTDVDDLAEEMAGHVADGARAVKMKIGGLPLREDLARVASVRVAIGDDVKLLVDANSSYRRHEAVEASRKLEKYDVYWLEEPLMPDDYVGHAEVARGTSIPIAAGENEYTRYGFRDLIDHRAASILNPDAQFVGGVTEFMKVAALAQAHDLPIAPHGNPEIHAHLAAALPNALLVEVARVAGDSLWDLFFPERVRLDEDGCVRPSEAPGFGIEVDEEALESCRVQ